MDKAGNESKPAAPVAGKYNTPQKQEVWITPKVKVNKKKGTVELSWEKPHYEVKEYLVYRRKEGEQWKLISSVESFQNSYSEKYSEKMSYKVLCKN